MDHACRAGRRRECGGRSRTATTAFPGTSGGGGNERNHRHEKRQAPPTALRAPSAAAVSRDVGRSRLETHERPVPAEEQVSPDSIATRCREATGTTGGGRVEYRAHSKAEFPPTPAEHLLLATGTTELRQATDVLRRARRSHAPALVLLCGQRVRARPASDLRVRDPLLGLRFPLLEPVCSACRCLRGT